MHSVLSKRLQRRIEVGNSDEDLALTVLLTSNLPIQLVENAMQQLRTLGAASVQYVPISGSLHFRVPMETAKKVKDLEGVEYVDLESASSVEELLDD